MEKQEYIFKAGRVYLHIKTKQKIRPMNNAKVSKMIYDQYEDVTEDSFKKAFEQ